MKGSYLPCLLIFCKAAFFICRPYCWAGHAQLEVDQDFYLEGHCFLYYHCLLLLLPLSSSSGLNPDNDSCSFCSAIASNTSSTTTQCSTWFEGSGTSGGRLAWNFSTLNTAQDHSFSESLLNLTGYLHSPTELKMLQNNLCNWQCLVGSSIQPPSDQILFGSPVAAYLGRISERYLPWLFFCKMWLHEEIWSEC